MPLLAGATTKLMRTIQLFLLILFPLKVLACWVPIPLETLVEESPLVIRGQITDISRAPRQTAPQEEVALDIASLRIDEILKSELGAEIRSGARIALAMPSVNNIEQWSTYLQYDKGLEGFWILEARDGKFWASYPADFQPLENRSEVLKALYSNRNLKRYRK